MIESASRPMHWVQINNGQEARLEVRSRQTVLPGFTRPVTVKVTEPVQTSSAEGVLMLRSQGRAGSMELPTMSTPPTDPAANSASRLAAQVPVPTETRTSGLQARESFDEDVDKVVDQIEMIGEEEAAGWQPSGTSPISPGMRYLHYSRTIHQLIYDRNRAV